MQNQIKNLNQQIYQINMLKVCYETLDGAGDKS